MLDALTVDDGGPRFAAVGGPVTRLPPAEVPVITRGALASPKPRPSHHAWATSVRQVANVAFPGFGSSASA